MVKKRVITVFLFLFASIIYADNVFVYIEKGSIELDDTENNIFNPELLNIMEDGIMESFFESGHIVFSANSAKTVFKTDRILSQAAKSGGAEILLKAVVNYSEKDNIVNITGKYICYNLYSETVIAEGDYTLPENINPSGVRIEDLFYSTGKYFADKVSGKI